MGFQKQVYINPANALPGDFASSNPMIYKLSANGKMVADASGVTIGKFAFISATGLVSSKATAIPTGGRYGFVHREMNGQIVTYLAETGYTIQPGEPVALFGSGDFFVAVDNLGAAAVGGEAVYFDYANGEVAVNPTNDANMVKTDFVVVTPLTSAGSLAIISSTGA